MTPEEMGTNEPFQRRRPVESPRLQVSQPASTVPAAVLFSAMIANPHPPKPKPADEVYIANLGWTGRRMNTARVVIVRAGRLPGFSVCRRLDNGRHLSVHRNDLELEDLSNQA